MGMDQDREQLESHIRELRETISNPSAPLSADTQVMARAALVQSEALMLLTDGLMTAVRSAADLPGR